MSTGDTIYCPQSEDAELPSGYYGELKSSGSGDPIPDDQIPRRDDPISSTGKKITLLIIVQYDCYRNSQQDV